MAIAKKITPELAQFIAARQEQIERRRAETEAKLKLLRAKLSECAVNMNADPDDFDLEKLQAWIDELVDTARDER